MLRYIELLSFPARLPQLGDRIFHSWIAVLLGLNRFAITPAYYNFTLVVEAVAQNNFNLSSPNSKSHTDSACVATRLLTICPIRH